jgi:hypothetical protein
MQTTNTIKSWGKAVQESPVLTRLVLSQAIITVLIALRTELYTTFVPACVCAGVLSVLETVAYQWYLTKHYGARLELVSRVWALAVSRTGPWTIFRDHLLPAVCARLGLGPALLAQEREVLAKVTSVAVGGVYCVASAALGVYYPWQSLLLVGVVAGPHVFTHVLLRVSGVEYAGAPNYYCGSHLIFVACVRHLCCVGVFWKQLWRDAEGQMTAGNGFLQNVAAVYFCLEALVVLHNNGFNYPACALPPPTSTEARGSRAPARTTASTWPSPAAGR